MRTATLLVLLGAVAAMPVRAGLFDDTEARQQIEQVRTENDARLQKLETSARNQIELANQIDALKQEISQLRGQIEVLTNDLDQAQKRQKDFYVDLDARMRKFEASSLAAAPAPTAEPTQASAPPEPSANETRDYETALNQLKAGKYKDAASAFQAFIKAYPRSSFLPSAHFWAASALYQTRDVHEAAKLFGKVADSWPEDARAPDALLGLSNCQLELGDKKGSRSSLEKILAKYPSSPAAQTAKQRLGK
ncbi:MAG: tol-pal system protein YbgF [Betaproteobacteria bacterium]|nr:tol-pal system protein YbgF [Betaproteobacteria bacterium]